MVLIFLKIVLWGKILHIFNHICVNNSHNTKINAWLYNTKGTHIPNLLLSSDYTFTLQMRLMTPLGTCITRQRGNFPLVGEHVSKSDRVLTYFLLGRMGRLRMTLSPLKTLLMGISEASLRWCHFPLLYQNYLRQISPS